jgi:hypothetical protein
MKLHKESPKYTGGEGNDESSSGECVAVRSRPQPRMDRVPLRAPVGGLRAMAKREWAR